MTDARRQCGSGLSNRRDPGLSTFRRAVLFAILLISLVILPDSDSRAGSIARASSRTISRLMIAAARTRDVKAEARIRWELARVLRDAGRRDEAIAEYRRALALD
ncbi:MAG: hypothetical protein ACREJ4_08060, partial [Candidatus Methylomirabilaceae bacterium]